MLSPMPLSITPGVGSPAVPYFMPAVENINGQAITLHSKHKAILLSDRIALMSNSPEARLAESFAVNLPRPRTREAMIDTDEYTRLRSHILHFLMRGSHALATSDA